MDFCIDFSLAEMNKNKATRDLTSVSRTLDLIIRPNYNDEVLVAILKTLNTFRHCCVGNTDSRNHSDKVWNE